eukprot:1136872-Ditylum_brightwellii.AAC.1
MQRPLHAQVQTKFDICIAKVTSLVNIYTKNAANHLPSSYISLFKLHEHNQDNKEKLQGNPFESSKQLYVFKHDYKVAMHGQDH